MGGSQRLTRAIGKAKSMDMCLTGRMMDAEEAERSGLVARIVEPEQLLVTANEIAQTIAGKSRIASAMVKEAGNTAFETTLEQGLRYERRLFHSTLATNDQSEGMAAFVEKRDPNFSDSCPRPRPDPWRSPLFGVCAMVVFGRLWPISHLSNVRLKWGHAFIYPRRHRELSFRSALPTAPARLRLPHAHRLGTCTRQGPVPGGSRRFLPQPQCPTGLNADRLARRDHRIQRRVHFGQSRAAGRPVRGQPHRPPLEQSSRGRPRRGGPPPGADRDHLPGGP